MSFEFQDAASFYREEGWEFRIPNS
jgi:hypothetical protein